VKFSYSTIQRWYYIILNNPDARIPALSKRRCDIGLFRSLSKRVCRFLASQANRQSSQSYAKHHRNLIRYMKQYEGGPPPDYSTVRRYLKSLRCSRNSSTDANIVRLEELVVHLRRRLIVQSTLNWLLRSQGSAQIASDLHSNIRGWGQEKRFTSFLACGTISRQVAR
jgi:hypothetical protein